MAAMTPWTYTDDMSVRFNLARALLQDNDPETAVLTDATITSTLATFGWQVGMAVLAQQLIVKVGQEVIRTQTSGGSLYQWAEQRLDGLKTLKAQADRGQVPDPEAPPADGATVPGSMYLDNQPGW